ncbi:hypothetical protein [Galbitalea soli]|uniref:Uncharacterized protein n=1 Tax=Galbitalea soli TaxID=1268042 RepID=A0A7C9TR56_9MICO|nr:hypothetical protein [Galbitalea soli]NEM91401.1 hypothetical protein [Galbitalea soli]NYJ30094.1 hypothetical protein [Galbitalea soli]
MSQFAVAPNSSHSPIAFDSVLDQIIRAMDQDQFDLLVRAVDLVVLSQVFTPLGLERAMRISYDETELVTELLEAMGVISTPTKRIREHRVLVRIEDLSAVLFEMYEHRTPTFDAA